MPCVQDFCVGCGTFLGSRFGRSVVGGLYQQLSNSHVSITAAEWRHLSVIPKALVFGALTGGPWPLSFGQP